jgi:hypothetical protein
MEPYESHYGGPCRAGAGYWDLVDYPLEQRPGRYSYRSPDPRCTCGIVQNGYSSQGLRLCFVHLYDDMDDEDVFGILSFSGSLGSMNMSKPDAQFPTTVGYGKCGSLIAGHRFTERSSILGT